MRLGSFDPKIRWYRVYERPDDVLQHRQGFFGGKND